MTTILLFWAVNLSSPTPWINPERVAVYGAKREHSKNGRQPWSRERLVDSSAIRQVPKKF